MQPRKLSLVVAIALITVLFSGCGITAPVIGVSIAKNPSTIKLGDSVTMSGSPDYERSLLPQTPTVTWRIMDGPGSISYPDSYSRFYVTYTAPAQTTSKSVTIRATADSDTSKFAEVTILFVP
jgi:hypothetical protein